MKKDTSDLLLLDVNVLLAIAWPNHQFHAAATRRLESGQNRWATCAVTQLGFVRLSSNPAAVRAHKTPAEAAAMLGLIIQDSLHVYLESLPAPVSGEFRAPFEGILGYGQVMDMYLLALARSHQATFVTFDAKLKHLKLQGANLEVLGALV
ncbi:MAG TPA: TA system VapC family ribonuclease toxin [Bryobacteraceae bacterium]|nr:TA system VapC family ribonuclease toxin [Bryobacteraceae bacterium]